MCRPRAYVSVDTAQIQRINDCGVGYLKGKSAIIVFENYSRLKRNFKGHSFWARGYYVNTVGLDEIKVRRYIQDQEINDAAEDSYNNDLSDPF